MKLRFLRVIVACLLMLLACCTYTFPVNAETPQSSSSHYGVGEVYFGAGGDLNDCSASYCAKVSLGETGVGNPTSNSYQLRAGFNTTDEPTLEVEVNGGTVNLGTLTTTSVSSGYITFSVLDYVSSGYNVIVEGNPPGDPLGTGGFYYLSNIASAANSNPGTEQFGINLMSNSTPLVGANVQQVPDTTFGFGTPSAGYNTADKYQYNAGDIIASSSKASGESLYTMSVIANISGSTPGGQYTGNLNLVVVASF